MALGLTMDLVVRTGLIRDGRDSRDIVTRTSSCAAL